MERKYGGHPGRDFRADGFNALSDFLHTRKEYQDATLAFRGCNDMIDGSSYELSMSSVSMTMTGHCWTNHLVV